MLLWRGAVQVPITPTLPVVKLQGLATRYTNIAGHRFCSLPMNILPVR
jgi:hypothetical protein